jgi:carboxyl-terminal processing protease
MRARRRCSAVLVLVLAVPSIGCGLQRSRSTLPPVEASLRPEADRFAAALGRSVGRPVDADDAAVRLFAQALSLTVSNYLEPVDPRALTDTAITGAGTVAADAPALDPMPAAEAGITAMMASLDDSSYVGGQRFRELREVEPSERGGVGLELRRRDDRLVVVGPIEGGPAARVGIRAGDRLITIDGMPTDGLSLVEAIQRLRGPIGTEVALTLQRSGDRESSVVRLVRARVEIRVTVRRLATGHGYVRISQFDERTNAGLDEALESLADGPQPPPGLVLDLRDNSGGLITSAVRVADRFLESGVVVSTSGRGANQTQKYFAQKAGNWGPVPMVVLVNGGTAAGAEIVAAALQRHARARLVGTRTFGHGTIATIYPLGDQAALRLTTARTYGPDGRPLSEGVVPDVVVDEPAGALGPDDAVAMRGVALLPVSAAAR